MIARDVVSRISGRVVAPFMLTPKEWNAVRREHLARLKQDIGPFVHGGPIDYAAYRKSCAQTLAELARLTRDNPRYLARPFEDPAKAEACAFHHAWMQANVAPSALDALLEKRLVLLAKPMGEVIYSVKAKVEIWVAREGELTLEMFLDKRPIFSLSFAFVPGALVGRPGGATLLIGRLQGARERFEDLRRATRDLSDVAPRAVVYAVLTGIARAAGIEAIAGVTAETFISHGPNRHNDLVRQYDDFFRTLDGEGPREGFYLMDPNAPPKPMSDVKAGHRIRTRRKRALKEEIAAETAVAWARACAPPPAIPAPSPIPPAPRLSLIERLWRWR